MHEPVRIEVIWEDNDIELRLMKALAEIADEAVAASFGPRIDHLALKRVGEWFSRRCSERVISADD